MINTVVVVSLLQRSLAAPECVAEQAVFASDALDDATAKHLGTAGCSFTRLTNSRPAAASTSSAGRQSTNPVNAAGTSSRTPCIAIAKFK
jgi:hypothetical protein